MELIKRYVYAVGKKLPGKQREDIEKELESSILDMLEDKFLKKTDYTEKEIEEVLKQLGPPWEVAMGYQKYPKHLIGPELIGTYFMVIKIVACAVAIAIMVGFIVSLFNPELTAGVFFLDLLKFISTLISGVVTAIGFVTVVFFLIEKNAQANTIKETLNAEWKVKDLPKIPNKSEKISIGESITGIVFTIIAIVIFNFFAETPGIYYTESLGEKWYFVQLFSKEAISTFLPFWNAVWIVGLAFEIFCLTQRQWNIKTRLFDILTSLLSIGVIVMMMNGPNLIDIEHIMFSSYSKVASMLPVAEMFYNAYDVVLILALAGTVIGLIVKTVKLIIAMVNSPERV